MNGRDYFFTDRARRAAGEINHTDYPQSTTETPLVETVLGFGSRLDGLVYPVPPGAMWMFISKAIGAEFLAFCPVRLLVPSSIAEWFELVELDVADNIITLGKPDGDRTLDLVPPCSCTLFTEQHDPPIRLGGVAPSGSHIKLTVRNISDQERPFRAAVFGQCSPAKQEG